MKYLNDLLSSLGFNLTLLLGGAIGSLIGLKTGRPFWQQFCTVVASALIANYTTPVIMSLFGLDATAMAGIGFIVGYSNKAFLEIIIDRLKKK